MSRSSPNPIRVLHVDDDPESVERVAAVETANERFTVEAVSGPDEGLDRLVDGEFDCVVSEYDLEGRDGVALLEAVRADHPELPFVLFTDEGNEAVASEAISADITDYLRKGTVADGSTELTERIEAAVESAREGRARRRRLRAIDDAEEGIGIIEADGTYSYVNEAYADLYGYEPEEMVGESFTVTYPDGALETVRADVMPAVEGTGFWRGETTGVRADGTTFVEDHTLAKADGERLVCSVFDKTDRGGNEDAIEGIHTTVRELMEATTFEAVAETAVRAVRDVVGLPNNAVHRYDEESEALVPVAWTDEAERLLGEVPPIPRGGGLAWDAFEDGERRVYDDVSTVSGRLTEETPIRSEVIFPLGDHGVLLVGTTEPDAFERTDVTLAGTFAVHATTALDGIRSERELRAEREVLEQQNERLERFAGIVSHDLRNPLTVAQGRLELLAEDYDEEHVAAIRRSHDRMEALIEDILTLAREGEGATEAEPVDLADAAAECWTHVETAEATLAVEATATVRADPGRLQQLLENCVRNAVEHGATSADGASDLTVTIGDFEGGFYVADDGPGIPENERDRVFEAGFSSADDGTGLGLNIVAGIAESHGWDIDVRESEAGGARFEVTGVETV
ncbi:HTR-like protein [Halosimplex carlsbadense 2-9-1]|uniref:histidine kinase n=1 Tax=Halosimplex carlsbadense 2-9-1 TaxID=797114 RepID=M0CUP6_9EURY|nr:ATP-binding protein [Halosimplex carlsbadense]ELZ26956.1 HTR-like protein [Halosimplex carlsbadense 2-9-1]